MKNTIVISNSRIAIDGGAPQRNTFLVFGKPDIQQPEIDEVVETMKSGWIGTGPRVTRFENAVKGYTGAEHAVALNSCTAGLHLSLLACGIGPGDEVIIPAMTFAATANVIEHAGAKPVLVDVDRLTMNIDPLQIEEAITPHTKAIMPVHMAGRPCDMDAILEIAKKYNLYIIEDAAHAFGAVYHGQKIGTIGDLTAFSFYVTKNLITGEGGMVTTNNGSFAEFIQLYALHGMTKGAWKRYSDEVYRHYLIQAPGYKYNMMDLQAAIGIHQLERFSKSQETRKKLWEKYNQAFADLPITLPSEVEEDTEHAYHLYTILIDPTRLKVDREVIKDAIHAENIGVGIHFISIHFHPFYAQKYGYKRGDFPNSEIISDQTISIPFGSSLSEQDSDDVIAAVRKVISYYKL